MKLTKRTRQLLVLCVCLVLLLGLGAGIYYYREATRDPVDRLMDRMPLRDKLAQMIFFCPRSWKDDPEMERGTSVTALSDEQLKYIADHRYGGFLLFGDNFTDAEQSLRLISALQNATVEGGGTAPFVAADQEGGYVARLSFGTTGVGNMALAATGDPACAREMAKVYGEEMRLLGLNTDFAPVMDVNDNPANPVIGIRAFSDDARMVGEYGIAYIEGLRDTGTIACIKHFPGHGNTDSDSHTGLPLVDRSHDALSANELAPFKAAIDAGADMVMTAHIQYPQVEKQTWISASTGEEIYLPATMSKTILTDILRGELGFEGLIVSDSLEMQAVWDHFSQDDMLTLCINAGVNMLILPSDPGMDVWALSDEMLTRAVALTESGAIDLERVNDSVRRILTLKQKCGLLDQKSTPLTDAMVKTAVEGCGSEAHRQTAWDIACKALTLLKNENNAFPMNIQPGEKTLILISAASRSGYGELSRRILEDMKILPEGAEIENMVISPETAEACMEKAKNADHVLIVNRAWGVGCLDPATEDGFPTGVINRVIRQLHRDGKTAVVISAQLPYDVACFPEADALLACYCSSLLRSMPNDFGAGSAWSPNLIAAICAAFGTGEPSGMLPVNLPALDGDFHLTSDILYSRLTNELNSGAVLQLPPEDETDDAAPDYTEAASWVAMPETLSHDADVFLILPTVNMKAAEPGNEDFTDERNASRYVKTLGLEQGIVEESADVYAPYYRQATLACFLEEDGTFSSDWAHAPHAQEYLDNAYEDIRSAWLYYLENRNAGRPVFLFGYSQGADMVLRLMAEFGAQEEVADRLVAAYAIGRAVDEAFLSEHPYLRMAQSETDTGVIISYNAMDERAGKPGIKEYAINPLNWKADSTPAGKEENLGYVVTNTRGEITEEIPAYCGAYLDPDSGKLIVTEADNLDELYEASESAFPAGDYHLYDLKLFYRNLQKNVADRTEAFLISRAEKELEYAA